MLQPDEQTITLQDGTEVAVTDTHEGPLQVDVIVSDTDGFRGAQLNLMN